MSAPALPPPETALPHFVSDRPFDPVAATRLSAEQERLYMSSQWRLMWL
jgi:peptide/nickel transport system permease protein